MFDRVVNTPVMKIFFLVRWFSTNRQFIWKKCSNYGGNSPSISLNLTDFVNYNRLACLLLHVTVVYCSCNCDWLSRVDLVNLDHPDCLLIFIKYILQLLVMYLHQVLAVLNHMVMNNLVTLFFIRIVNC